MEVHQVLLRLLGAQVVGEEQIASWVLQQRLCLFCCISIVVKIMLVVALERIQIQAALLVQKTPSAPLLLLRVERAPVALEPLMRLLRLLLSRLAGVEGVTFAIRNDHTRVCVAIVVYELLLILAAKMIVEFRSVLHLRLLWRKAIIILDRVTLLDYAKSRRSQRLLP